MLNLAKSYTALGRHAEALSLREKTLRLRQEKLGLDHPETLKSMNELANSYATLGRHEEALRLREETLRLRTAQLGPNHPETLSSLSTLANSYRALGQETEALRLHEETWRRRQEKLGPERPETLESMNHLAWILATASDEKVRDPKRAMELARAAVAKRPENANHRTTLGVARYRLGDWKGAIADLEEAVARRGQDNVNNAASGFFLAMAYWQLGEKEKARQWYDRAVQWMDKELKDNTELKSFRAEAAALLEIKEKE